MPYGPDSTDDELRRGCLKGDRRAQQALYQRYFGKLLGIPMRYTGSRTEATALLNQAFFQAFKSLDNWKETGSFAGWLSTITFRVTMDHLRMEQRHRERYSLATAEAEPVFNQAESKLQAEDIFRYVQQLPAHLRDVFSLYVIDGYKHEEIAALIGITISTSKWRLSKARELLQAALEPHYKNNKGQSA
ncbi:MAG: RNA polymerase sigma factor [Phaeodactylibacter sp.]|nr:RNA polymerase sigma factor [Phaeodactylibacter sp.]MCB9299839.1 RNA polymerase sigma factor [Lewinellaceae bacterium]